MLNLIYSPNSVIIDSFLSEVDCCTNITLITDKERQLTAPNIKMVIIVADQNELIKHTEQILKEEGNSSCVFYAGARNFIRNFLSFYNPERIYADKACEPACFSGLRSVSSTSKPFKIYYNTNFEELQYLNLFKKVLEDGDSRPDRTGTGTISTFAQRLEFSLENNQIPVLTSKKMAFKTLAKELLWFISGCTDSRVLEKQGVKIWTGNSTRQYLDSRGLVDYQEGELGPVYGFQWRHFGAEYSGLNADYSGKGIDQLQDLIASIRTDPYGRRHIMSAWNPADLKKMALPPCHILYQLYVTEENGQKYLSAQMYQRSADSFLGVGFNIASYALLTHIIAQLTAMKAKRLVMVFGDYHIYKDHIDQVKEQLSRQVHPFPKIYFERDLRDTSIDTVTMSDFNLLGYRYEPTIKARMSV